MNKIIYINVLLLLALAVISIPSLASSTTGPNINILPSGVQKLPSAIQNILLENPNVSLNVLDAPLPQGSSNPNFIPVYYLPNGTQTTTPPYLQKNFTSSVTQEVQYLKSKGINDSQIVEIMKALNITYYPDTGNWVKSLPEPQGLINLANEQLSLADEQLKNMSSINQINAVQTANPLLKDPEISNGLWTSWGFAGFAYNMKTGVMGVDTSNDGPPGQPLGTNTQYVTTHLGSGYCTEIGVWASSGFTAGDYQVYIYDPYTLGGFHYIGWQNNAPNTYNAYQIWVSSSEDGTHLYPYYVFYNGVNEAEGHLLYRDSNQVSQTKEIFNYAQPGAYYNLDGSSTIFQQQYLFEYNVNQMYSVPWDGNQQTSNRASDNPCQISDSWSLQGNPSTYTDTLQVTGSWT